MITIHSQKARKPKKKKDVFAPAAFAFRLVTDDQLLTNASSISMFVLMSLVPLLLLLFMLMSRFQLSEEILFSLISEILPEEYVGIVEQVTGELYTRSLGVKTFSFVIIIALWASSTGISELVNGLNKVYKWQRRRNWFYHRALCLLYTIVFLLMILMVLFLLVFGRRMQEFLILRIPSAASWTLIFTVLRNVLTTVILFLFFLALYQLFPQKKLKIRKQIPGALTAATGWYVFSLLYSDYIRSSRNLPAMYGSLSLVIFFLVWLYVCILIILIGGEVNYVLNNRYYYKLFLITRRKERVAREQRKNERDWDAKPEEETKKWFFRKR